MKSTKKLENAPEYGSEHLCFLIPREDEEKVVPPRYFSRFRSTVANDNKFEKFANKTMGPAKVNVRTPENFLKKSDGSTAQMPRPPNSLNKYNCSDGLAGNDYDRKNMVKKPAVPRVNEQNPRAKRTEKDFIVANAVENITSVSRTPKLNYVDTNTGHTNDTISSGLVPRFSLKPDFGTTPDYLRKRQATVKQAQEEYDTYVLEKMKHQSLQAIDQENKDEILSGLKAKWEELHHQYQGISVVTDTAPKKNRKERLEAQMSHLERDIALLERTKVYVAN